ncbi:hypothetical protein COCON_G00183840 [Conger conger]|uniref:Uncharacterized protein n=1 Tax=Conger conger TaxID=82655 RepID=A0A9Q1D703_CONCO|nr:hypothetical protein COCON_G00183840 [Conger conger]
MRTRASPEIHTGTSQHVTEIRTAWVQRRYPSTSQRGVQRRYPSTSRCALSVWEACVLPGRFRACHWPGLHEDEKVLEA